MILFFIHSGDFPISVYVLFRTLDLTWLITLFILLNGYAIIRMLIT